MVKAIFLDMDDTLIVNQVLYEKAEAVLLGYLVAHGADYSEAEKIFQETDRALFKTLGISRTRFPLTFEKTLLHFVPEASAEQIATVRGFAETVFQTVAKLKPDVKEALALMHHDAKLYLVTAGDLGVQQFRVDHLPFREMFDGVFIVPDKTKDVFLAVAKKLSLAPKDVVVVGDSLRSDVFPAAAAGMQAIWIEAHNSPLQAVESPLPQNAVKFSSLLEAARNIHQYDGIKLEHIQKKRDDKPSIRASEIRTSEIPTGKTPDAASLKKKFKP